MLNHSKQFFFSMTTLTLLVACNGFDAAKIPLATPEKPTWIESQTQELGPSSDVPTWEQPSALDSGQQEMTYADRINGIIAKDAGQVVPAVKITPAEREVLAPKAPEKVNLVVLAEEFEKAANTNSDDGMIAVLDKIDKLSEAQQKEIFTTAYPLKAFSMNNYKEGTLLDMFAYGDPKQTGAVYNPDGGPAPGDSESIAKRLCKYSDLHRVVPNRPTPFVWMIGRSHKAYAVSIFFTECDADPNFSQKPGLIPNYFHMCIEADHSGSARDLLNAKTPVDIYALDPHGNTAIALLLDRLATNNPPLPNTSVAAPVVKTNIGAIRSINKLLKILVPQYKEDQRQFFLKKDADSPAVRVKLTHFFPKETLAVVEAETEEKARATITDAMLASFKAGPLASWMKIQQTQLRAMCERRGFVKKDCQGSEISGTDNTNISFTPTGEGKFQPVATVQVEMQIYANERPIDELYTDEEVLF